MDADRLAASDLLLEDEFNPRWDVYRDADGVPVTVPCFYGHYDGDLTDEQIQAVRHAVRVWVSVCMAERSNQATGMIADGKARDWLLPNVAKSRLLERMIHHGLPPTRTKPPIQAGGPAWWLLPGGDPFVRHPAYFDRPEDGTMYLDIHTPGPFGNDRVAAVREIRVCGRCGALVADRGLHDGKCPTL